MAKERLLRDGQTWPGPSRTAGAGKAGEPYQITRCTEASQSMSNSDPHQENSRAKDSYWGHGELNVGGELGTRSPGAMNTRLQRPWEVCAQQMHKMKEAFL